MVHAPSKLTKLPLCHHGARPEFAEVDASRPLAMAAEVLASSLRLRLATILLIPVVAGLALAVRRRRLAARQRAPSVHQAAADVLKWRARRRTPNVQAAVQQDGNAHKSVAESPKPAPLAMPPQQRMGAAAPMDATAAPADAALGAAARRVKLGDLLVRQGHGAGSAAVRALLKAGRVTVNGALERSFARKIADGFDVQVHASAA